MPRSRKRTPSKAHGRKGRGGAAARRDRDEVGSLEDSIREAIADEHPLALLQLASSIINALDPRNADPFDPSPEPTPDLGSLLESFVLSSPELAAFALVIAQLSSDELLRSRITRLLAAQSLPLPAWVSQLKTAKVLGAAEITEPLNDSYNVVVHVRVADFDLTLVSLVDFNLGGIVKDAFATPMSLTGFVDAFTQVAGPDGDHAFVPLSLADAAARLRPAVELSSRTWPREDSESWPAARPLLDWALRQLPEGGADFARPSWSARRRATLVRQFLGSPYAAGLGPEAESVVEDLVWYRCDYGWGDPLRWSPTAVEILLLDWYSRKIVADRRLLLAMPETLRAFIRFGHARARLPQPLTESALAAVDRYEPEYRRLVSAPRRQGAAALLERLNWPTPEDEDTDESDEADDGAVHDPEELRRLGYGILATDVGGAEALAALDDQPLPEEDFDWQGVPEDARERVASVLQQCDDCCAALFDLEHRTAVRRLLHDVALARPLTFTGRGSDTTAAAALCWMVARANGSVGYPPRLTSKELFAHFGLTSGPGTRAETMRRALDSDHPNGSSSDPVRYLTSSGRAAILRGRDAWDSLADSMAAELAGRTIG